MPFKKVKVIKMVEEKRSDPKFVESYRDVEKAYKLKRFELESSKYNGLEEKDSTEKQKKVIKKSIP
jgi:hypothetical protein